MELILNLAWMVLTALMCGLWIRYAPVKGATRRTQFIALALVLVILFPVISVTDDLARAQSPAETDSCQRKAHAVEHAQTTLHPITAAILPLSAAVSSDSSQLIEQRHLPIPAAMLIGTGPIHNRPPPVA